MNVPAQYRIAGRSASAIATSVETEIRDHRLEPGSSLPTVRDLARRLRVRLKSTVCIGISRHKWLRWLTSVLAPRTCAVFSV